MAGERPPEPPESDAALFRRLGRSRLSVRGGDRSWPLYLGYAALAAVALFVFVSLSRARTTRTVAPTPVATVASAPTPPAPVIAAPVTIPTGMPIQPTYLATPAPTVPLAAAPAAPGTVDAAARLRAPAVIVDLLRGPAEGGANTLSTSATAAAAAALPVNGAQAATRADGGTPTARGPSDEQFAARVVAGKPETVAASHLASTSSIAPQGTVIPAVLETGLNSSLPGYVRAVVSRDVRGFDGSTVLIPRGTRLIGEYKSGVAVGQSRAFVVWSRLLTPEGVSMDIGSPAVDPLGRGGIQGEANTHFLRRFGAAVLLSVLSAGLEAGVNHFAPSNGTVVIGTPQQANNVASIALQRDVDIPATITVPQGSAIRVFVARDLDFAGALPSGR